jgi:hypothetical protein
MTHQQRNKEHAMGYHVRIVNSTLSIPDAVKSQVYAIWCDLNKPHNDHLKSGGGWSGGGKTQHWYSWMDEHYDQTCLTVEDILDQLGFEHVPNSEGGIDIVGYDSKTGQEDLFFQRVVHLLTGKIRWQGEDGGQWTWLFDGQGQCLRIT